MLDRGIRLGSLNDENVWCGGFVCAAVCDSRVCASSEVYRHYVRENAGRDIVDREAAIQCQQFRQDEAATAVYNEATLLLASYRACLEKYEQAPVRAREYCGQYGKALQDIGLQIKEPIDAGSSPKDTARTSPKPK